MFWFEKLVIYQLIDFMVLQTVFSSLKNRRYRWPVWTLPNSGAQDLTYC